MADDAGRPHIEDLPGKWPSAQYLQTIDTANGENASTVVDSSAAMEISTTRETSSSTEGALQIPQDALPHSSEVSSTSDATAVAETTMATSNSDKIAPKHERMSHVPSAMSDVSTDDDMEIEKDDADNEGGFAPIKTEADDSKRYATRTPSTEDISRILSRRKTNATGVSQEDADEIERLLSRMFGSARQANTEQEVKHVGVVFKNLTVKGLGLGAAIQPTISDPFLALPRKLMGLFKGAQKASGKPPVRTILDDFTGCIKPGEMLLVLGAPGAGCSTFLKVLANQRFGYESIEGDVTYGGTDAKIMGKNYRGEILYNPEDDLHYATLTVKQTLSFALKTRTPGKASRNEGESRTDYIREFLRVITKLFWIEHTLGTKVGNEYVRGVSGGEKKRVSIAEAMITKASTQCWDNSTRGLDASTALEYVQSLRSLTNMANISTSVALYQAGESLYELFDKVILIHEGKCLYFGPTEKAATYFEGLGFARPARWTTADFLTSVTDQHEREIQQGMKDRIPRSTEQFVEAFRKSDIHQDNLRDIQEFQRTTEEQRLERQGVTAQRIVRKNYTLSFWDQVNACTKRQFLIIAGDKASVIGKWGSIVFQALIVGSLFYNLPKTSAGVFTRGGVLFLILLFNALLALAEITAVFSSRAILQKHRSFSFYRPAAFALAQTMVDIPLILVQVSLFNIVVYFMAGLARTPSQFFITLLFLFTTTMTMYAFFRAIGAWSKSLDVASRFTGVAIQALIVYTGYLIPPRKMHPWFSWLRYINPIAYGFEALMSNEFYNLELACVAPNVVPTGPGTSSQYQSCTIQGSQPGSTIVNGSDYISIAFEYTRSHLWRNFGIIIAFWAFFLFLTIVGMEFQKPNAGGGAVTIFKRGKAPVAVQKALDKGTTPLDEEKAGNAGGARIGDEMSGSETDEAAKGVAKNETVFTYQNVNYIIPVEGGERQLLNDVQGYVRPGKLTALMGASGAGKTTLLNTLAQRINFGVVSGDFLVDGKPLPKSFQRATGFAEQQDVHEPTATVREALRFSALLRQPREVPIEEKYEYCERIIDLLEMRDIAGAIIGEIGEGLNQEQRKRLTIGVELASKPELLMFLDEPTSGLDSGAAFNIVRFLRKLADAGQAILCTIHQPSSVLFEYFDELLLLKSGGRVVYHGPLGKDSRILIDYLEANGGRPCPPSANPAEYMLEVIGAGNPDYKGKDWGDVWANSAEKLERTKEIEQMIVERRTVNRQRAGLDDNREYAMPLSTQVWAVIKRSFTSYWRTPQYMAGKFILHIFTGLFNTFTFYHVGEGVIDMQSRLFSIFMTLTIAPPLIQQLQPKYLNFRQIYKSREAKSKIYSWLAFVTGAVLVEIPYVLLAGTLYFNTWWWGANGRHRNSFESGYTWMLVMLFELFYVSLGQAIAAFSPNDLLASILVPVFFIFVVSFCGVVVPFSALPHFWQSWMYYLTPFRYLLSGFLASSVHGIKVTCADNELARFAVPPGQTCQSYTQGFIKQMGGYVQNGSGGLCEFCQYANGDEYLSSFNVFYPSKWFYFGVFIAFIAFNYIVIYLASWLYLGGVRDLKVGFGGASKKQKKIEAMRSGEKV